MVALNTTLVMPDPLTPIFQTDTQGNPTPYLHELYRNLLLFIVLRMGGDAELGLLTNLGITETETSYDVKDGYTFNFLSGSTLTIQAGATVNVAASGIFQIDGTTVTSSAAELNFNDGATAGTVVASKTVVVDANKDITSFRNLTAENLISTNGVEKTDFIKVLGIADVLAVSVGTWTVTRIAQADYVYRHTPADETAIIAIDITESLRTTASRGLRLTSIDFIYKITTADLDAHTATLDSVVYANNSAVAITSVPLTGSLSTAQQANPYVTSLSVTTPAYLVTDRTKYMLEITVDAAATSEFDFYGIVLKYARNDL